jgi:hypothetical protein
MLDSRGQAVKQMQNNNHQNKKIKRKLKYPLKFQAFLMIVIFAFIILFFNFFGFALEDIDFSKEENRNLTQRPSLNLASITDGSYAKNVDSYYSDQFFLRNSWIRLKVKLDLLCGKRESNGVFIGKDDYLMEIPADPDPDWLDKNLASIAGFAERHADKRIVMSVVPNSAFILAEKVPTYAYVRDQAQDEKIISEKIGEKVDFVEMTDTLRNHADEYIFYKTDHHWTSLGAKYVFENMTESLGINEPVSDYDVYPVSNDFSGSMASKSGYQTTFDEITIMVPRTSNDNDRYNNPEITPEDSAEKKQSDPNRFVVQYPDNRETCSLYHSAALQEKDQYTVFLGGNYSRLDIQTLNDNDRCLLLIKDSYANCFVQFLIPYYEKIVLIDPRYYYDEIEQVIAKEQITDILFLYNMNTFLEDRSLADVLTVN